MTSAFGRLSPFSSILLFPPSPSHGCGADPFWGGSLQLLSTQNPSCCSRAAQTRTSHSGSASTPHRCAPHPSAQPLHPQPCAAHSPSQQWTQRAGGAGRFPPPPPARPHHIWWADVAGLCCPDGEKQGNPCTGRAVRVARSNPRSLGTGISHLLAPRSLGLSGDGASPLHLTPAPQILLLHSLFSALHLLSCTYILHVASAAASHVLHPEPGIQHLHPIYPITCPAFHLCSPKFASAPRSLCLYPKFPFPSLHTKS